MNLEKEIFELSLDDILPNRFQPREKFDNSELEELASSIKEHGVIQPIIVRKIGDKYEIVAGERRFRASKLAGKETIPALIRNIDDRESAKIALLENLQRKNLTPIEEAKTYQTIIKLENLTQEELANNLGKSQSAVANKLRLLNLTDEVQQALLEEKISERHARSLLNVSDPNKQIELLNKVITNRLTVKQLDDEIAMMNNTNNMAMKNEENSISLENNGIDDMKSFNNDNQLDEINDYNKIVDDKLIEVDSKKEEENVNKNIFDQYRVPDDTSLDDLITPPAEEKVLDSNENYVGEIDFNNSNNVNINEKSSFIPNIPTFEETNILEEDKKEDSIPNENIYDLRFAINNFRQAIQNTEKFGILIESEEFDLADFYQFTIKIIKNNKETNKDKAD